MGDGYLDGGKFNPEDGDCYDPISNAVGAGMNGVSIGMAIPTSGVMIATYPSY